MSYRKFLKIWIAFTALLFLAMALFNYMVDPLAYFRIPAEGIFLSAERQVKPKAIQQFPHNALIIGTSKPDLINPDDININGLTFYNASMASGLPEEIATFLERYVTDQKLVIVGLDLFTFNERDRPLSQTKFGEFGMEDYTVYLANFTTLINSIRHIRATKRGDRPANLPNGQRNPYYLDPTPVTNFSETDYEETFNALRTNMYGKFDFSYGRIKRLKEFKANMDARGVKVIFYANPLNEFVYRDIILADTGIAAAYKTYISQLSTTLGDSFVDYSQHPIGRFTCFYAADPHHYLPSCGAEFVKQLIQEYAP